MPTNSGKILVVDDDFTNRTLLATNLEEANYLVEQAEDGQQALEMLLAGPFDVVLLDLLMPGINGFEVLTRMKADETLRHLPVIVISAVEEMDSVVRCIEMGATDYLTKPFDPILLHARLNASLAAKRLHDKEAEYLENVEKLTDAAAAVENETFSPERLRDVAARSDALGQLARVFQRMVNELSTRQQRLQHQVEQAIKERYKFGPIVGKSQIMQQIYEQMTRASASDASVVIMGESGTGKELVAQTIHQRSPRRDKTFVPVNCGAIPEALFEREFFGHHKGAFTGADRNRPGFFDAAHGGTLFLDEIGELSANLQVKLLRVLQSGEYTPIGSQQVRKVDVRLIAATNRDLKTLREQRVFRDDFFYRIYVMVLNLPPLRNRKEDIPLLIDYFLEQYDNNGSCSQIPGHIIESLLQHDWPGNIRELQNVIQRYISGEPLDFINDRQTTLIDGVPSTIDITNLRDAVEAYEKRLIAKVLEQHDGNTEKSAATLNIPLRTLYGKIKKHHLR